MAKPKRVRNISFHYRSGCETQYKAKINVQREGRMEEERRDGRE